jgi:hypothetical protein
MDTKNVIQQWAAGTVMLLLAIVALVAPFGLMVWLNHDKVPMQINLPLLAIAGVAVLFGSLALVAISFSTFGLADKTQALGLPEGSVRAFIALALVVVFAIVAFSVYGDLSQIEAGKTPNPAAIDFAKQLLTLVGTLVTAVASFYFGAATATSAQAATNSVAGAPNLRSIDPTDHDIAAQGPKLSLKITGDHLDLIKEAKIVKGKDQIVALSVHSNASEVTCELTLPVNAAGVWDVVVTDGTGRQAKLTNALTIK